jgi:hypothetical protein
MTENECLSRMIAPGTKRPGKWRDGVIQIWLTRACNLSCYNCTQGSNLGGNPGMMTPAQFEIAVKSLKGYWGVVGVFGGNPAVSPHFIEICKILRDNVPYAQRGLWCNHPISEEKGIAMRETFNPAVSNLNTHLDTDAYEKFKLWWPESMPFGLREDSRHSPCYVAMKDVLRKPCPDCLNESGYRVYCKTCEGSGRAGTVYDEEKAWELISNCDINKHWSAMIGVFRGEVRAWFCEIAGAQAMLHQGEEDYPDTGVKVDIEYAYFDGKNTKVARHEHDDKPPVFKPRILRWWELPMTEFYSQVRKHCHECSVPLRGYGELAQAIDGKEQVSTTHERIYKPKQKDRRVELVTISSQLGKPLGTMTHYLQNSHV